MNKFMRFYAKNTHTHTEQATDTTTPLRPLVGLLQVVEMNLWRRDIPCTLQYTTV